MTDSTNPRVMADNIRELSGNQIAQGAELEELDDKIEALGSYLATETDTGQTFLGAKVYRKVFAIAAYPNNTTLYIDHGITNLGVVLDLYGSAVDSEGSGITVEYRNTLYLRYTLTQIGIASTSDYSGYSGYVVIEYTKSAAPTPDVLHTPDPDTRSLEEPETEPVEPESIEEKK